MKPSVKPKTNAVVSAVASQWVNYHHLLYFKTIAEQGSIAKASKVLKVGQPALSAQLGQFEDRLGFLLFDRINRSLILTDQGHVALQYAHEIFRLGSEMVEVLNDRMIPSKPHVEFGALDSVPKNVVLKLLDKAYQYGRCKVSLLEGDDEYLMRELISHKLDLYLTNHRPKSASNVALFSKRVARFPVIICGHRKFENLRKGFPKSLDQIPFVLPTKASSLRMEIDHFFSKNNISVDCVAETQDTSVQKLLGLKGIGIIPIATGAVEAILRSGDLVKIGELDGVEEEIFLVSATRKIANPIAAKVFQTFSPSI